MTDVEGCQIKDEKGHFLLVFNPIVAYYDQKGIEREALVYENNQTKDFFTNNDYIHFNCKIRRQITILSTLFSV